MSASSVAASSSGTPQERLSAVHGVSAKAALHPKAPETFLRDIAKDTIQIVGKQGSAATDIEISEGRLSAKLSDGSITVKQLEALGVNYAVRFAEEILRQLGPLATPKDRIRAEIRAVRRHMDEIEQGIEHIA